MTWTLPDQDAPSRLKSESEIRSLLARERYYRDTRQWQRLRESYHPDPSKTMIDISWSVFPFVPLASFVGLPGGFLTVHSIIQAQGRRGLICISVGAAGPAIAVAHFPHYLRRRDLFQHCPDKGSHGIERRNQGSTTRSRLWGMVRNDLGVSLRVESRTRQRQRAMEDADL